MKYLAGCQGVVYSATSDCFDLVGLCYLVTLSGRSSIYQRMTSVWPIYVFPISNIGSRKYYLWKKYDWLENRLFFITENFLGILYRLCTELMRRSHDFLSLTLTGVRRVKWMNQKRFDVFYCNNKKKIG